MIKSYVRIITCCLIGLLQGCVDKPDRRNELESYIPEDAGTIVKVGNMSAVRAALSQNELLNSNQDLTVLEILAGNEQVSKIFTPVSPSYLIIHDRDSIGSGFTWIARKDSTFTRLDSILQQSKPIAGISDSIYSLDLGTQPMFVRRKDSVYLFGTDAKAISEIVAMKPGMDNFFKKKLAITDNKELIVYQKQPGFISNEPRPNLADESALEIRITDAGLKASGVLISKDSTSSIAAVFKGQVPQFSTIQRAVPSSVKKLNTFAYSDLNLLHQRLSTMNKDSLHTSIPVFFEGINEIGEFTINNEAALVTASIDASLTEEQLAKLVQQKDSYRNTKLYDFLDPELFVSVFDPLITRCQPTIVFRIDNYFYFTETRSTAEYIITAITNNQRLSESAYYTSLSPDLVGSSSIQQFFFGDDLTAALANLLSVEGTVNHGGSTFPLGIVQISNDRNFAHFNFVCREVNSSKEITSGINELFSKKLETDVLLGPQLFSNHRTGGMDVVFQDISNKLYLVSASGKTLWARDLGEPILGEIHEVDILKNGKKQLAFTTGKKLYVVDRNGKDVRPFPLSFNEPITQPLSVFDYDNNRNYRFVIVQGKRIRLYDRKGKHVSGFTFSRAASDIVLPAEHIRISNKDYIVLAEDNGRLNILSRTGKPRINVSKEFNFSEIRIQKEGSDFVVITSDKTKERIDTSGRVESQALGVSDIYWFKVYGRTKATLDDNLLRINGKLTELPYGIYSEPRIYRIKGQTFVLVCETQDSKVYLFKDDGTAVNGFPVYGNAPAELGYDSKIGMQLTTRGSAKEVIYYQVK